MRIVIVTLGYAPLRMSGLDISGERLVRYLLDAGHHVTVIAACHRAIGEAHQHSNLCIKRIAIGPSNWIGYSYRAAQLVKQLEQTQRFDVVHFWDVHFAYAYPGQYVASLHQSFRQRIGSLALSWSSPLRWVYYQLARAFAEHSAVTRARGLLAVSATTRAAFIQEYELQSDQVALTPHGIDLSTFHPVADTRNLRAKLGIASAEPVILFAGFVTPRKGIEYLAHALPLIRPKPRLVMIGRWSPGYQAKFTRLLGTAANQVVEAGFVPDEAMPAFYSLADVYVSPSLLEGFGLPIAEALACGTPVVAVQGGAVAEVAGPGGILVPPRNPAALAHAISMILNDQHSRATLGEWGRNHIAQRFSVSQTIQSVFAAYKRFL